LIAVAKGVPRDLGVEGVDADDICAGHNGGVVMGDGLPGTAGKWPVPSRVVVVGNHEGAGEEADLVEGLRKRTLRCSRMSRGVSRASRQERAVV
jgi:hypothetical protein